MSLIQDLENWNIIFPTYSDGTTVSGINVGGMYVFTHSTPLTFCSNNKLYVADNDNLSSFTLKFTNLYASGAIFHISNNFFATSIFYGDVRVGKMNSSELLISKGNCWACLGTIAIKDSPSYGKLLLVGGNDGYPFGYLASQELVSDEGPLHNKINVGFHGGAQSLIVDGNDTFVIGGGLMAGGQYPPTSEKIVISTDGGNNFLAIPTPTLSGIIGNDISFSPSIKFFANNFYAFNSMYGRVDKIAYSNDCQTWKESSLSDFISSTKRLTYFKTSLDKIGVATIGGDVYVSTGGDSWVKATFPVTFQNMAYKSFWYKDSIFSFSQTGVLARATYQFPYWTINSVVPDEGIVDEELTFTLCGTELPNNMEIRIEDTQFIKNED